MGISFGRLFKKKEDPVTERVAVEDITDQSVRDVMAEACILELAFWTCVGKIANMLSKCEFRTFVDGKEIFGDEYYLWNYSPNPNQNKSEFWNQALGRLYRENELLVVSGRDGSLYVADSYSVTYNALYGDTYSNVTVGDHQFPGVFHSKDVMRWRLNDANINRLTGRLFGVYGKIIEYSEKSYLKSRGNRGTLNISAIAQADKKFDDRLKKLTDEYFKSFFNAPNAVLPLFDGYTYTDLGSKTYNESSTRDIKSQYDDLFDFTARSFSFPPSLAKGDVQDTGKAVEEALTFCLDPLAQRIQEEANRKRNGPDMVRRGTCLRIDTKRAKHIDLLGIGPSVDKLLSSGVYTVNMLLRVIGEERIDEPWADRHFMTKNYASIQELLDGLKERGGNGAEGN